MNPMGSEFIKAIVICLLSKRFGVEVVDSDSENRAAQSSTDTVKPQNSKSRENSEKRVPCFISGYSDGRPIYSTVRVVPDRVVAEIEMEIA